MQPFARPVRRRGEARRGWDSRMQRLTAEGEAMATSPPSESSPAFEAWLVAREPTLQRTAHLLTGDVHTAQDLVQNTLAKLYLRWEQVRRADNLDAYARKALLNEFRSAWRRP